MVAMLRRYPKLSLGASPSGRVGLRNLRRNSDDVNPLVTASSQACLHFTLRQIQRLFSPCSEEGH
jgi:hypothetical protein